MQIADFNYFGFCDLFFTVLLPILVMIGMGFYLKRLRQSFYFVILSWCVLIFIISTGLLGIFAIIQLQRNQMLDYVSNIVKSYSLIVSESEHAKITCGNVNDFSDWSEPASPVDLDRVPKLTLQKITASSPQPELRSQQQHHNQHQQHQQQDKDNSDESKDFNAADSQNIKVIQNESVQNESVQNENIQNEKVQKESESDNLLISKLSTPQEIIIFRYDKPQSADSVLVNKFNRWRKVARDQITHLFGVCNKQIFCQWNPVYNAAAYRVEWRYADNSGIFKDDKWSIIYSGSQCFCVVDTADVMIQIRVRAETGTPEDNPVYRKIDKLLLCAATSGINIASVYTMRFESIDKAYYVVYPWSDFNNNGIVDKLEEPAPIGELFDCTKTMKKVFSRKTGAVDNNVTYDTCGGWITAYEPIYKADGQIDGIVCAKFSGKVWFVTLMKTKFWPYCFFFVVLFGFFGCVWLIAKLQNSEFASKLYAIELNHSITELTKAKSDAEVAAIAKSEFLANMSHEIRTPMNAILGMIYLTLQTSLNLKQREFLENAEQSATLLLRIINDILDFSKIEAGKMVMERRLFSLKGVIDGLEPIVGILAKRKALKLELHCELNLQDRLLGDAVRLQQVLVNLLTNAIKFTKTGEVVLNVWQKNRGKETITFLFSVRDTGIGIKESQLGSLFHSFTQADTSTTRKFGGTGLGLVICKNIVRMMNGEIWCESKPNCGSNFFFTAQFDIPDSSEMTSSTILPDAGISGGFNQTLKFQPPKQILQIDANTFVDSMRPGVKVLIAEDNRINQLVLSELLRTRGCNVEIAENGQAAVEMVNRSEYDIVFMDIQMPEMDGIAAVKLIRQDSKYSKLPIIALTAHAMMGDRELSLEAGMNDHLTKPIDPDQLYKTLAKWIPPSEIC
ncbi:MAG: response regulator [Planctomycetaceae bacterium]|jgi:signal transduction histidine kinase/CheY-like chemotaxis protein|nr:response regulator [Planctomycetaceae bacterium]